MIERTEDVAFLKEIATHPRVWPYITEDGSDAALYEPMISPMVHYLRYGDKGFFQFAMLNRVMYACHVSMLPKTDADEAAKRAIEWMWANTEAQKLVCYLPPMKRHAIWFAKRAGFTEEGRLRAAFLLHGILHDLIILGVQKCPEQ